MYLWQSVGTDANIDDLRMPPEAVKEMLKSGVGPWQLVGGVGAKLYWGRLFHTCESNLKRCSEEVCVLSVEKGRLGQWIELTLSSVEKRGLEVAGSGKGILLSRWKLMLDSMKVQLAALKW